MYFHFYVDEEKKWKMNEAYFVEGLLKSHTHATIKSEFHVQRGNLFVAN